MSKIKKAERIMISVPAEMLELLDHLQKEMMYPTRSSLIQEGIRRIALEYNQDKKPEKENPDLPSGKNADAEADDVEIKEERTLKV